jgi:outer membrane protein insertion porin family
VTGLLTLKRPPQSLKSSNLLSLTRILLPRTDSTRRRNAWPLAAAGWILVAAVAARAQEPVPQAPEDWEGRIVRLIRPEGFHRERLGDYRDHLHLRKDMPYDAAKRSEDLKRLLESRPGRPRKFADVSIVPEIQPSGELTVVVRVLEFQKISGVNFKGLTSIQINALTDLRQQAGEMLDPYLLKIDRETIQDRLVQKGYHFSKVEADIQTVRDAATLTWRVTEGPLVTVRSITITGNRRYPESELKNLMLTKEAGSFLVFPISGGPYIQFALEEDLKRLKLAYYREGWLDITKDERIFIEDVHFSPDRTLVDIRIHVDEGEKYRIRNITFRGHSVIPEAQMRTQIASLPGDEYTVMNASGDAEKIREMYGERAYILAQVEPVTTFITGTRELDLEFRIIENQEITVGRIMINGNTKTRFDVILRELRDFAPGEKFNRRLLQRGLQRLRDKQYFDPMQGYSVRLEEGQDPTQRDVILDVKEGSTGSIRFAGGYSSSFGILGIIEFRQTNFDIADLPKSVADIFTGEAFAGGGQQFEARFSPAATARSFLVSLREPYVFGYDFGMGVMTRNAEALRESWEEEKLEGAINLDKRWDHLEFRIGLHAMRMNVDDLEFDAPSTVRELEGTTRIMSITTGLTYDNRDSIVIPTRGHKISLTYEYAGDPLPGDFDFGKTLFDIESYFPTFEIGPDRRHVLNLDLTIGYARAHGDSIVPYYERYYAGGRGSIRGFDFRGIGPRENGDPIGGNAYVFFSTEYAYPLVGNILWITAFYDVANLTSDWSDLYTEKWRNTLGFGIKFVIPQLGNIPVSIDFGFPYSKHDEDDRETVTFDIGRLFF